MTNLPAAALQLAQKGLAVFPCQPRGKEPACDTGLRAATTDVERINRWWQAFPDLNIGIATGMVSGINSVVSASLPGYLYRCDQQAAKLASSAAARLSASSMD